MKDKIIYTITMIFFSALLIFLTAVFCGICYDELKTETVETYIVGCEVSQMAYAEEATGRSTTRPVYKMGVRNDDFAVILEINDRQFAQYVVGDVVEIEVTVIETGMGTIKYEYKIIE